VDLRTQRLFQSFVENSTTGVMLLNAKGFIMYISPAITKIINYNPEQMIGRDAIEFIPSEEHSSVRLLFKDWIVEKSVEKTEIIKLRHKDGYIKSVEFHGQNHLEDPLIRGILIYFRDITKELEFQYQLQESENKFKTAFKSIPIILAISTLADGKYIDVNEVFLESFSFTREEIIGKTSKELNIFQDYSLREKAIQILSQDGYVRNLEINFNTRKKGLRIGLFSVSKIKLNDVDCLLVAVVDITQTRKFEQEKEESEKILKLLFDKSNDLIFTIDLNGNVKSFNKALQELSEYSTEEIQKMNVFQVIAPEYHELVHQKMKTKVNSSQENTFYEIETIAKSGKRILMEINSTLIYQSGMEPLIATIARDISFRKQLDEEKLRGEKMESIALLAGGLAHDFNNLLVAILGNINLLPLEGDLNQNQNLILEDLENATIRCTDLTKQLLTFSKGGQPIKKSVDLNKLVRQTADLILRGSNCKTEIQSEENISLIEADQGQISQAINNIFINAKQVMPKGGIINILIQTKEIGNPNLLGLLPGRYIQLSIEDHGPGIPERYRNRIFEPYFTSKPSGTGLGLATAYSIFKHHGGTLTYESTLDEGTTFYAYLPVGCPIMIDDHTQKEQIKRFSGHILIMDDDESVKKILGKFLDKLGFTADYVATGEEALQIYVKSKFTLVIMDLTIRGGMGGKVTLEKLQIIDPEIKAIVSSGYSDDDVIADYKKYGFVGSLRKPYTLEELQKVISRIL
jgi:PAS domain S-box-containing protein